MDQEDYDQLVEKYDYETKLDIACWVMSKVDKFGRDPGSFRYFIYQLLGFNTDAYVPMYYANTMGFTNEFDYSYKDKLCRLVESERIDSPKLKNFVGLCDTAGCYKHFSCGTPHPDNDSEKYRWTCGEHKPEY